MIYILSVFGHPVGTSVFACLSTVILKDRVISPASQPFGLLQLSFMIFQLARKIMSCLVLGFFKGLFGFKEVGGSEEVGSRFLFSFWKMRICVSFPVFGW